MTTAGGLFSNKTATPANTARRMCRTLRVGDVQPFVSGESRELTKFANRRIGTIAKAAQRAATNEGVSRAKKIMGEAVERERLRTDPFEQAKQFLQRRGMVVFCCSVVGGPKDLFVIRGKDGPFSRAEIVRLAERKGWGG